MRTHWRRRAFRVVESPLMGGVRLGLIPPANHTFCTVNKEVVMYGHAGVLLASIPLAVLGAVTVAKTECRCGRHHVCAKCLAEKAK